MSRIQTIEDAIVARLKLAFTLPLAVAPAIEVRAWPDKPDSFRMQHPVATALVMYAGGKLTAADVSAAAHEQKLTFRIALLARNLRDHSGMYQLTETARLSLMAFTPPHATGPMLPETEDFQDYDEGVWNFTLTVSCSTVYVVDLDAPGAQLPGVDAAFAAAITSVGINPGDVAYGGSTLVP